MCEPDVGNASKNTAPADNNCLRSIINESRRGPTGNCPNRWRDNNRAIVYIRFHSIGGFFVRPGRFPRTARRRRRRRLTH